MDLGFAEKGGERERESFGELGFFRFLTFIVTGEKGGSFERARQKQKLELSN